MHLVAMTQADVEAQVAPEVSDTAGVGALMTHRGNLALSTIDAAVSITGLIARVELTQGFHNPFDEAVEATYIFPLPDRAAVTAARMTADNRTVAATLKERGAARAEYAEAIAHGHRAAIAEEDRPDLFTMRVGNILPGERVTIALTLVGPLAYADGAATFRLPLVVAPRYVPGAPLAGPAVGDGFALDTDAVPDASRISPPVLLPGFPNPVRLTIGVDIDAAGLPLSDVRSSLHAVVHEGNHLAIRPGERVNRDFILRLAYGEPDQATHTLILVPDAAASAGGTIHHDHTTGAVGTTHSAGTTHSDGTTCSAGASGTGTRDEAGTFQLTIVPPTSVSPPKPRDVVLLLDRSGSMDGWKMVAARRAAARIVDTLTATDRFAVLTFDHVVAHPPGLSAELAAATDRNRFRAVEHLAGVDARGGTELLEPLTAGLRLLTDPTRDRVLVLVTDGQVGNEDQIIAATAGAIAGVRVHTVGIDQAVNAGFLGRLAMLGGGRCELVESEDRLDDAMAHIHRRIGSPVVTKLDLAATGLVLDADTITPRRLPDLFPGVPLVVSGRYHRPGLGAAPHGEVAEVGGAVTISGRTRDGAAWSGQCEAVRAGDRAVAQVWARAHLRDLEDAYLSRAHVGLDEQRCQQLIITTSLRFGVLCRFTAWLVVDTRVVTDGGRPHQVVQPVEPVAGWDMLADEADAGAGAPRMAVAAYAKTMPPPPSPMLPPPAMPSPAMSPSMAMPQPVFGGVSPPPPASAPARARRVSRTEAPSTSDQVRVVRDQIAAEVGQLRQLRQAPGYLRREALVDLGTRLHAVLRHLTMLGTDPGVVEPLRGLVAELDDVDQLTDGPAFEQVWDRVLRVLDQWSAPAATGRRSTFWKRAPMG